MNRSPAAKGFPLASKNWCPLIHWSETRTIYLFPQKKRPR
jgi:hypothetical protein